MIEFMQESEGNLVGIEVQGKLTDKDYQEKLIPELEKRIKEHGKLRVLVHMKEDFKGIEPKAVWDDALFGIKHRKDFDRFALVGGSGWMDWAVGAGKYLFAGDAKTFPGHDVEQAWDWVKH